MSRFAALFLCLFLPLAAAAQERPNTILVLDGSGSMWGQIDGVNKIVIARDVVGTLLDDFPADENLGLTVYGHRTRGDCADIETIVAPGTGTIPAIRDAVNGINPRGKTPMTDAIIAAAEALRYTEEAATVILVSDGIETCNPDPCAAARALESAGIDFTAHVVGFDVTDPEALAQMQCLADETGGTFTTAANAEELTRALETVAVAPQPDPEPAMIPVALRAVEGDTNGPLIGDPILWSVTGNDGAVLTDEQANPLDIEIAEGSYTATAYRVTAEAETSAQFVAIGGGTEVVVVFPEILPSARIVAPQTAALGDTIQVGWDGPNEANDYIAVSIPGDDGYVNYSYTRDGNPLALTMPPEAGNFEIRYIRGEGREILASAPIEVTPIDVTVTGPAEAIAGDTVQVGWTGPDYQSDYITVSQIGEDGYENYTYTRDGSPLDLVMPTEPGDYELRYVLNQDRTVMATQPITVTEVTGTLIAPDEAEAGATIEVGWDGPDYQNDYIAVSQPDDDGYENYTYTRQGNPLELTMPTEPGEYEIRYVVNQDRTILARRAITVTAVGAAITAPTEAVAGATVSVTWQGPDYQNDYIGVGRVGEDRYLNYTYTRDGTPLDLVMPTEPGDYEIRYYVNQDSTILTSVPITLTPIKATVSGPATARIGEPVQIDWTGPDYHNDYIGVGAPDADRYLSYEYTRQGNPAIVRMPVEPGTYELRYYVNQHSTIVARAEIEVTGIEVTLLAPDSAPAGSVIQIGHDGPDFHNDYIGIAEVGADRYVDYEYTRQGNPLNLTLPDAPGQYELRYYMNFGGDPVIGRKLIEVTAN